MNKEVEKKLDELLELAREKEEVNLLVLLLAIKGAFTGGIDGIYTRITQDTVRVVLLPLMEERKKAADIDRRASLN